MSNECNTCYEASTSPAWVAQFVTRLRVDQPCKRHQPPAEHGPDWSDWGIDHPEEGPSCQCGFNGTPEECSEVRSTDAP